MTYTDQPSDQPTASPSADQPRLSNFTVRILTAVVLLPLVILCAYIGGALWGMLVAALGIVGALEFCALTARKTECASREASVPAVLLVLVGFYTGQPLVIAAGPLLAIVIVIGLELRRGTALRPLIARAAVTLAGMFYIGFPMGMIVAIRNAPDGFTWLMVILSCTFGTDTLAYFGGRMWGRRKLAPRLSPKKTVEGAIVGVIGGFVIGLIFLLAGDKLAAGAVVTVALAPFVAVAGDLFESALKRFFDVKDSHLAHLNIIPGHGGVLDRVDALMMVTVLFYGYLLISGLV